MNTFDDKLGIILDSAVIDGVTRVEAMNDLKALFEAEMLEIIGDDDKQIYGKSMDDFKFPIAKNRNNLRGEQRIALKEKLGREDKQPIWDALNNSDA